MKAYKTILLVTGGLFHLSGMASDFSLESGKTVAEFKQIGETRDGIKIFDATKYDRSRPGKAIDRYTINCKSKEVVVAWGPTSGGSTGIELVGGGKASITDKSEKNQLLSLACP